MDEADGSVTASLVAATDGTYRVGSEASYTVEITDEDLPEVRVSTVQASLSEAEGAAVFTVTRVGDTAAALTVLLAVAQAGDYLADPSPPSVAIPRDSASVDLTLALENDDVDEALVSQLVFGLQIHHPQIGFHGDGVPAPTGREAPAERLQEALVVQDRINNPQLWVHPPRLFRQQVVPKIGLVSGQWSVEASAFPQQRLTI